MKVFDVRIGLESSEAWSSCLSEVAESLKSRDKRCSKVDRHLIILLDFLFILLGTYRKPQLALSATRATIANSFSEGMLHADDANPEALGI